MMTDPEIESDAPDATEQVQLLFVRHENSIRAFVRALQPSLSDADDVMQETFLTISRKASTYEPGTNFVAWACGVARLKVLENFRRRKRGKWHEVSASLEIPEGTRSVMVSLGVWHLKPDQPVSDLYLDAVQVQLVDTYEPPAKFASR